MQVGPFTPEIQRVKRASEIASQVGVVFNWCVKMSAGSTLLRILLYLCRGFQTYMKLIYA